MNNIDSRTPFFPTTKSNQPAVTKGNDISLKRNSYDRTKELTQTTSDDARVVIPETIRDFSRIKKAVDAAPEIDNSEKVARLKQQIQSGTYQVDYDALADRMLATEY